MTSDNILLTGSLTSFGSDIIDKIMGLNGETVRQWRKRGFFNGGEKQGRGYLYTIKDISKLLIMKEMSDVGVQIDTASVAADFAATELIAHLLKEALLVELWASPNDDTAALVDMIRDDEKGYLSKLFATDTSFNLPANYLVSGGDDYDDWTVIDELSEIEKLGEYNLTVILLDLRKLTPRFLDVLTSFGNGANDDPNSLVVPSPVVSFHANYTGDPQIVKFSTELETPIVNMGTVQ